jgi:uncharacterized protein
MTEHKRSATSCPICGKPVVDELRPFCSRRCADVDLGRWLTEQYRIPGTLSEADEEPAAEPT